MPNVRVPAAATGLPKFNRKRVEDAIERLIWLLDITDPDPEAEDGDDDFAVDDRPCDDNDQDCEPDYRRMRA